MGISLCFPLPGGFFLLQKILYTTLGTPHPANGGILDPVAAVVAGLPTLGSLPKLTPQTLRTIIQTTADEFLRRGLDLFL